MIIIVMIMTILIIIAIITTMKLLASLNIFIYVNYESNVRVCTLLL